MMTGIDFEEVLNTIVDVFDPNEFDRFLYTKLNFARARHVANGPFLDVVTGVLQKFDNEGRDPFLIAAVAAARPLRQDVQRVYRKYARSLIDEARQESVEADKLKALEQYGLVPKVDLQRGGASQLAEPAPATSEGFQKQIRGAIPMLDTRVLVAQIIRNELRVCRVEVDDVPLGTGFLIGPDAVLTNYHVLRGPIEARSGGGRIKCRFDYRVQSSGVGSEGTLVGLAAEWDAWHLDSSPPLSGAVEMAGMPGPTVDQLDHALIRLDRRLGDEPTHAGGSARGWIRVPENAPALTPKMPVLILQHPNTEPVKLAIDTESLLSVNDNRTRVRYATNTSGGSSGSPCFNVNWSLIALHHFGDPSRDQPGFNQGIPIDAIRDRLSRSGKGDALGGDPP